MKGKKTVKKEIIKENKKPPVKDKPKNEKEKNDLQEKHEITEELEKKMYEGQEHIEEIPQEQSNQENVEKEVPKKQMIVKPRETYLKEKMSKMNCNENLMSNIKKELGDKVKNIIKEENILITETQKDLKKYMPKSDRSGKTSNQKYLNKQKYKEIKKLKDELIILKHNLTQLNENEKLLQDEGFNSKKGNQNTMFDKSIKEQQLKQIQEKKESLIEKIKSIEYQMKNIMEDHSTLENKEKVKLFLENFERDKEIVEIRAKKYLRESKEREKRMQTDIKALMEKRKKEIEEMDKKEKLENDKKLEKLKKDGKEIEQRQYKKSEQILVKYKPYINQKPEKTKKDYLYNKRYVNYIKREEKLFKDQTNKMQKQKEKISYKFEDISKFAQEFDEKLENRKYELEQKSFDLSSQWTKNREKLPKSNYNAENLNAERTSKSKEFNFEVDENGKMITPFQKYAKMVREEYVPDIDEKKRKQREDIIYSLEDPKNANKQKKYTLIKQRKNRILLKKMNKSLNAKYKWKLKLEEEEANKIETINQNLIHKPKKINLQPIITREKIKPLDKKPDYLQEIINKNKIKSRAMSSKSRNETNEEIFDSNQKSKKWEKIVNNKKGSLIENITDVQQQAKILEEKANMNEKIIQVNGGFGNNVELGQKVSDLLIDSIQAKINVLKKMNEI